MMRISARARLACAAAVVAALWFQPCAVVGEQITVRLRIAWGSSAQSPLKWHGSVTAEGAKFESLQPLGIEADEAAAVRLVDNHIKVAPLVRRAFDGCDVTVTGDDSARVRIQLQDGSAADATTVEANLGQLAREPLRRPLDELGSYLLVDRAPGDRLRVQIDRNHLVFNPGETLEVRVTPDLTDKPSTGSVAIEAQLHAEGGGDAIWRSSQSYDAASQQPLMFSVTAPTQEGAYTLSLKATQPPEGLAGRLVPWEQPVHLASRDVNFVVVDPARRLPQLVDQWETVTTIDPANTSWWQRLPQWTSFDKLPAFSTPRPLGNVKPIANPPEHPGFVQLPPQENLPAPSGDEPAWQAYLLGVRRVGEPHAVEIELPRGVRQHLAVSIVEPDAAGRVFAFGRDCGVYCDGRSLASEDGVEVHRIVFWPRTKSPALLLANRSPVRSASYGKIRLLHRSMEPTADAASAGSSSHREMSAKRLVAAYIASPRFAEAVGAAEHLDAGSQLSVDSWQTFLDAANRLCQQLRADGYNGAIVTIAADGSSLAPIDALGASPRYDSGLLAASGADPVRKDVLELLLRVFDREGLQLIPAVQLEAPLPGLEALRSDSSETSAGLGWIDAYGKSWSERYPAGLAVAPHYNLLHPGVQEGLAAVVEQLASRYQAHPALAGVALQLSGKGYGVLPGAAWGMDDATVNRFERDADLKLTAEGPNRVQVRGNQLLGPHLTAWKQWRNDQVTAFYRDVAQRLARQRPGLRLVLCTEDLFGGNDASEYLRQSVAGRAPLDAALDEVGLDLRRLAATPGVALLRPHRLADAESVDLGALDERINAAPELDQAFAASAVGGEVLYHTSARLRLPSFDQQSPFGAHQSSLSLSSPSLASGEDARRALVSALAVRDFDLLANGADTLLIGINDAAREALRTLQELPPSTTVVRNERRQPVTLRVYREAEATTVCLLNESPWPVDVKLPADCTDAVVWRQLGAADAASAAQGSLSPGPQSWTLTLPAYGIAARRFASTTMRVGALAPQVAEIARADLMQRIADIEQRMQDLDVERPYNHLQNPQFELAGENGLVLGWQPRIGSAGTVELVELDVNAANDADIAPASGRAIHLQSENATGVAIQSHLFALPETGQLVVRAMVRTADMMPGAKLYAWVEYQSGGAPRQRYVALGGEREIGRQWTECEFAVDDLPLGEASQMRIQFHLAGAGQAWIDDVRLYDLRFPKSQRDALAKRLYAAKTALEENQFTDCQRLVEGYWPRRLVEHLPATSLARKTDDAAAASTAPEGKEAKGFNDRLRGIVPRILR